VDDVQKHQELQVDLMFVDKVTFLLGVLIPMKYTFLAPLASQAQSAIWPALKRFTVDIVRNDPEGGVVSSESELAELGCQLNPGGSKEAVPVVERTIRTIKERAAIKIYGKEALAAMRKEMSQILEKGDHQGSQVH
jgi:hypothetical protein